MTLPNLISFSGCEMSGRKTAADVMAQRAGYVKTYMAKPIEQLLVKLDPWIVDHRGGTIERFSDLYGSLSDYALKDFDEVRRLLRVVEDEVGRRNGQNLWTDLIFEEVQALLDIEKKVAVAGVRHKEELDLVRTKDGVCVWINRDVKYRSSLDSVSSDDCDVVVENNGTVKDLYINVVTALEEYDSNNKEEE